MRDPSWGLHRPLLKLSYIRLIGGYCSQAHDEMLERIDKFQFWGVLSQQQSKSFRAIRPTLRPKPCPSSSSKVLQSFLIRQVSRLVEL